MTKRRIEQQQHLAVRRCVRRHDQVEDFSCFSRVPRDNRSRIRQLGAVLPIVLLISAMMLATSAAWFETSIAAARGATNVREYLQAFHAADSALTLCTRSVIARTTTQSAAPLPTVSGEPVQWKLEAAFEAGAVTPVAQWPGSLRAPQCLVEAWRLATRTDARAYLLTSRGFGRTNASQVWLQVELVIDGEKIERHWRRVAARPF
ncbi:MULTISPECIES: pilus assembly PilX family protein [Paraburkholderia]|uniref:pilus assembly PilX family protein n=1 Tax=Paraburkholderia TaxID=1822464 RepID=UPI0038BC9920